MTNKINLAERMTFRLTGWLGWKKGKGQSDENCLEDESVKESCRFRLDRISGC